MQKRRNPDTKSGMIGEEAAAKMLEAVGYEILCRNYHCRFGEIDIIACDAAYLVFIEVKTRRMTAQSHPFEAITASKQRKILLAAQDYLQKNPTLLQPRFDAVAVLTEGEAVAQVTHLPNAFMA